VNPLEGGFATEAERQQRLLRALWSRGDEVPIGGWLRESPARALRGLAAYRNNGRALAERALAAAFPTVAALVGVETFALVAGAHWQAAPPTVGDLARFGDRFAAALAADPQLAEVPYLGDVARLEWALHRAEHAADDDAPPEGLEQLADADPAALAIGLRAGVAVVASRWPIVTLWLAHRAADDPGADRFAAARAALAQRVAETAIVYREGWRARVETLTPAEARFTAALLAPQSIAGALDAAGADFDFEAWLLRGLRLGWIRGVLPAGADTKGDRP
jgi:hypothetical protein